MCAFSHLRVVINSDIIQSLTYYILPSCNSVECFDKKLIDKLQLCVGPLVKSKRGYRFFLTAIDFATSFVFCLSNEVVYTWRNGYELAKIVFFNLLAHLLPSYLIEDRIFCLKFCYKYMLFVMCELLLITLRVTFNLKSSIQPPKRY